MRIHIRADGFGGEQIAACVAVIAVHVVLAWWLLRPLAPFIADPPGALQVHWIERVVPTAALTALDASTRIPPSQAKVKAPPGTAPVSDEKSAPADTSIDSNPVETPHAKGRPMSAVFLEQGRRWAAEQVPAIDFKRGPLTDREDLVAINKADQFHMREPMSVARVASGIGKLFGGPDYTTNPCPQIRANLANLNTGGDRALVDEEVRRLKRLCQ